MLTCEANFSFTDQLRYIAQDASSSQKPTKFKEVHLNAFLCVCSIGRYIIQQKVVQIFDHLR